MLDEFRCKFCNRLLAKVEKGSRVEVKCPKCRTVNFYQEETVIVYEIPVNTVTRKMIQKGLARIGLPEK